MAGNTIGTLFRVSTFGESHGAAIGVFIDGFPAGYQINEEFITLQLQRRKPGQSKLTTQRQERENIEWLSGIYKGKTLGSPICAIIRNENQKESDYEHLEKAYRPSHADYTYQMKYGYRDHRGGGRASARETAARLIAGALAQDYLNSKGIKILAYTSQIAGIKLTNEEVDESVIEQNLVRCPNMELAAKMEEAVLAARKAGDSLGGIISCMVKGLPAGVGEPVFEKLNASLGQAMLSINAVKGFEIGSGFEGASKKGSQQNDLFYAENKEIKTRSNNSGGIQGGISNGQDIEMKIAFKPVATIMQKQKSVDINANEIVLEGKGRHDPCVLPRAVPIVEGMAAIVLLDHYLRQQAYVNA